MNIGDTIRIYRKEKGMTQEEMAVSLGVSTPAVNKWENGISCPDISLLSPIARLLGISLDTLLSFEENLSNTEIENIIKEAQRRFKSDSFKTTFLWIQQTLHTYPNCEMLMWQLSVLSEAEFLKSEENQTKEIKNQILNWYNKLLKSQQEMIRTSAADALFRCSLRDGDAVKAEEYLKNLSLQNPERKRRYASLYTETNQHEKAWKAYEELLFTEYQSMTMTLSSLSSLALKEENLTKAHQISELQAQLDSLFGMGKYYHATHLLEVTVAEKDVSGTVQIMKDILEGVHDIHGFTRFPLYEHMSFKTIDSEFTNELHQQLMSFFQDLETFDYMKDNEWWKEHILNGSSSTFIG